MPMKKILIFISMFFIIKIFAEETDTNGFFSNIYMETSKLSKNENDIFEKGIKKVIAEQTAKNLNALDDKRNYDQEVIQIVIEKNEWGNKEGKIQKYLISIDEHATMEKNAIDKELEIIKEEYDFEEKLWMLARKKLILSLTREMINGGKENCVEDGFCFDFMYDIEKNEKILFGEKQKKITDREPCEGEFFECYEKKLNEFIENEKDIGSKDGRFKNYGEIVSDLKLDEDLKDISGNYDTANENGYKNMLEDDAPGDDSIYGLTSKSLFLINEVSKVSVLPQKSQHMSSGLHICKSAIEKLIETGPPVTTYFATMPSILTDEMIKNQKTENDPILILNKNKIVYDSVNRKIYPEYAFLDEHIETIGVRSASRFSNSAQTFSGREKEATKYKEQLKDAKKKHLRLSELDDIKNFEKDFIDFVDIFDGILSSVQDFSSFMAKHQVEILENKEECETIQGS